MSGFLTVNGWTYLSRLADGRVMCCLCFGYFTADGLNPVEGGVEDVCIGCAKAEAADVRRAGLGLGINAGETE